MPRRTIALIGGAVIATVAIATAVFVGSSSNPEATLTTPQRATNSPTPIVVVVMENHEFDSVVNAPYLSRFADSGTLFTNYHAITHPSLPNYLAMTAGNTLCSDNDCARPFTSANNIFRQLGGHNLGWRTWAESMPSNCAKNDSGDYWVHHNPPPYYSNLVKTCPTKDTPYPSPLPGTLKPFTFIVPNKCHDMHDCSVSTGDDWLSQHVPPLLNRGAIVVITFDEGSSSEGGGGHIYTAVVGPGVPSGRTNNTSFTHYSLLAGLEDHFGLKRLGNAVGKTPLPL